LRGTIVRVDVGSVERRIVLHAQGIRPIVARLPPSARLPEAQSLNPKVNTTLPAATVTYCFPSTAKVIGAECTREPTAMCQSSSPLTASSA